jgi:hypothetical protein
MNRREVLQSLAIAPIAGLALSDKPAVEGHKWLPQWLAEATTTVELKANKSNHPDTWHLLRYLAALQMGDGLCVFYGFGEPEWLTDAAAQFFASICEIDEETNDLIAVIPICGVYRTPCRWAWAMTLAYEAPPEVLHRFRPPRDINLMRRELSVHGVEPVICVAGSPSPRPSAAAPGG